MTTVAWDGKMMAADTLATDVWGMRERQPNKVLRGEDFLVGCAGEYGQIAAWWRDAPRHFELLLRAGYDCYAKDNNDPALVLVGPEGYPYRHVAGSFLRCSRPFHAVGSGRDYALAAMHLGCTAEEAVRTSSEFDVHTGVEIICWSLQQ